MTSRPEAPREDENWADYIDRLRVFDPPTHRTRRAAWRLEHPAAIASPPAQGLPSCVEDAVRK